MRTSRQFHQIMNDCIVFKAMMENGHSCSDKMMTAWVVSIQSYLPPNSSASQWARLAHANDMAAQLITWGYIRPSMERLPNGRAKRNRSHKLAPSTNSSPLLVPPQSNYL
jgi:hypothetical protein